jgi:serine/threonine protein kinase
MWLYKNEPMEVLSSFPEGTFGFIYRVVHEPTGKTYIGKKVLFHQKKVKLTKKELLEYAHMAGRKPAYKLAMKESDWETYYGSNKEIVAMLKEGKKDEFKREILYLATSKKLLTYYETKYLFVYSVLEKPEEFYNDNILGKFFTKDFAQ